MPANVRCVRGCTPPSSTALTPTIRAIAGRTRSIEWNRRYYDDTPLQVHISRLICRSHALPSLFRLATYVHSCSSRAHNEQACQPSIPRGFMILSLSKGAGLGIAAGRLSLLMHLLCPLKHWYDFLAPRMRGGYFDHRIVKALSASKCWIPGSLL